MKNGPPAKDKTMPSGSSNGANKIRESRSQKVSNAAPPNADDKRSMKLSSPNRRRMICGVNNPTKPNNPEKLTAAPARAAAASNNINLSNLAGRPRLCAVSCPKRSRSSSFDKENARRRAIRISQNAGISRTSDKFFTPPIRKSVYPFSASGKKVITASIPAPNMLDIAAPDSTIVIRDAPARSAINKTSIGPAKAAKEAARGAGEDASGAGAQHSTVANPAPELTPIILGAARGLFNTRWIITPETANEEPAIKHPHSRGSLA